MSKDNITETALNKFNEFSKVGATLTKDIRKILLLKKEELAKVTEEMENGFGSILDDNIPVSQAFNVFQEALENVKNLLNSVAVQIITEGLDKNLTDLDIKGLRDLIDIINEMINFFTLENIGKIKEFNKYVNENFTDEELEINKDTGFSVDETLEDANKLFDKIDDSADDEFDKTYKDEKEQCDKFYCNKYVKVGASVAVFIASLTAVYFIARKIALRDVISTSDLEV
jgi:hypothetical protein